MTPAFQRDISIGSKLPRGVYVLASDNISTLLVAFLEALRSQHKAIPICIIPYNDDVTKVRSIASHFQCTVFQADDLLAQCDQIAAIFHTRFVGEFRKLVCWHGPFQQFVYMDADTILLRPLDVVFDLLSEFDWVASHSHIPHIIKFTWKSSISGSGLLSDKEIAVSANMGFIASRIGVVTLQSAMAVARQSHELAAHMESHCADQPFMNALVIRAVPNFTSIHWLREHGGRKHLPHECWAGDSDWTVFRDGTGLYRGTAKPVLFVHWAGEWSPRRNTVADDGTTIYKDLGVRQDMKMFSVWLPFFRNSSYHAR